MTDSIPPDTSAPASPQRPRLSSPATIFLIILASSTICGAAILVSLYRVYTATPVRQATLAEAWVEAGQLGAIVGFVVGLVLASLVAGLVAWLLRASANKPSGTD